MRITQRSPGSPAALRRGVVDLPWASPGVVLHEGLRRRLEADRRLVALRVHPTGLGFLARLPRGTSGPFEFARQRSALVYAPGLVSCQWFEVVLGDPIGNAWIVPREQGARIEQVRAVALLLRDRSLALEPIRETPFNVIAAGLPTATLDPRADFARPWWCARAPRTRRAA